MKRNHPYEQPDARIATDEEIIDNFAHGPRFDQLDDILADAVSDLDRGELMNAITLGDDAEVGRMLREGVMAGLRYVVRHDLPGGLIHE